MDNVVKQRKYWVLGMSWTVKAAGAGLLLLILAIFVGEGPPNPLELTARELVLMVQLLTTLVGLALAVWRQLTGGIIVLAGIVSFTIFGGIQHNWVFYAFWVIGLLNILCWWLKKS
ncbi:MAG: hypothetical protein ABIG61_04900 [Planctomycetota bacterium]